MCYLCETKPVYEFTNKRKVCARCFIKWFEKKVFYTIRKFKMVGRDEVIFYENKRDFRSVVLKNVLNIFSEKARNELIKLSRNKLLEISNSNPDLVGDFRFNKFIKWRNLTKSISKCTLIRVKRAKIAIENTSDIESYNIIHEIINKKINLKKHSPIVGKTIKPLYLFLDKEVLLYTKLKKLKFINRKEKEDKISNFINNIEEKHPELKHSIVNSYLEICG